MSGRGLVGAVKMTIWAGACVALIGCNLGDDPPVVVDNQGNQDNQNGEEVLCEDGEQQDGCACPDGATGYQVCADGEFGGECVCEEPGEENLCGGTSELIYGGEAITELGGSCGPCDDGTIQCDGEESVTCVDASPAEACMPTGSVEFTAYFRTDTVWDVDQHLSVFLLENYSRACYEVNQELGDSALMRPVNTEEITGSSMDLEFGGVPVGVDYTIAVVLHVEVDDTIVTTSVGCEEVRIEEEGAGVSVDDVFVRELPAALGDEYRLRLMQDNVFDSWAMGSRIMDIVQSTEYRTANFGSAFLGCLVSSGSCDTGGTLGHLLVNWDQIGDLSGAYSGSLVAQIENIDTRSEQMHGNWQTFWWMLEIILDERWQSLVGVGFNGDEFSLGDQIHVSLSSLSAELDVERRFRGDVLYDQEPFDLVYTQDVAYSVEGIELVWAAGYSDCFESSGVSLDHPGCQTQRVGDGDEFWLSPSGDLTLRTNGWNRLGLESLDFDLPLSRVVGRMVDDHLEALVSAIGFTSGTFFSNVFDCTALESDLRALYELERSEYGMEFTDGQLDNMMDAFQWLCEGLESHGEALLRGAFQAPLFAQNTGLASTDRPMELYEGNLDERYFYSLELGPSGGDWSPPALSAIEADSSSCEHYLFDLPTDLEMCVAPDLELLAQ